ncbi:hypothetical protein GCM10027176_85590 [Actinoallomurus bryophytorum]
MNLSKSVTSEVDLGAHRRQLERSGDEPQVFDGAGATDIAAVPDEAGRFAPPRVEYALTPLGRSLGGAVDGIVHWVREHQAEVIQNRAEFDAVGR